jgi:protein ImuB
VRHEPADATQPRLVATRARRTLDAAARAFARLRAAFGEGVVVRARVRDAHLPRARVAWEPVDVLVDRAPTPGPATSRPLVRRLNDAPERLHGASSAWLHEEVVNGRVTQVDGPYVVSGGWWRGGVHRDYYFLHTAHGDVHWMYYDRPQRAWFAEGFIE